MKNNTFICIGCRTTGRDQFGVTCPLCRQSMHNMGPAFRTPRKQNDNEWRKLQLLIEHKLHYFRWRCDCVGCSNHKVPRTFAETKVWLRRRTQGRLGLDVPQRSKPLSSWMHRYGRKRRIPVT